MNTPSGFRPERLHRPDWYVHDSGGWHLRASRCPGCGSLIFPIAHVCPRCWPTPQLEETVLPETGKLLSWTTTTIAPTGFRPPYSMAYVDLTPTVRLFGQIEDGSDDGDLVPDSEVELILGVVRYDDGEPVWAYKFTAVKRRRE